MMNSESEVGQETHPDMMTEREKQVRALQQGVTDGTVLGVLTGQVPVRSMPVWMDGTSVGTQELDGEMLPDGGEDGSE